MVEDTASIARRVAGAWSCGDLQVLDELIASNVVDHTPLPGQRPGREGFKEAHVWLRTAFPTLRATIKDVRVEDKRVTVPYHFHGEQLGDFVGIPGRGSVISFSGDLILQIEDGKVIGHWA